MKKWLLSVLFLVSFNPVASADINVRTSPLGLLLGAINVEVDFPINSAWTVGPQLTIWNAGFGDFEIEANAYGARANYFLNQKVFTDGWYFGPSLNYASVKVTEENTSFGDITGEATGFGATGIFGHYWGWDAINIMLGGGVSYFSVSEISLEDDSGDEREDFSSTLVGFGFALEFTLGFVF